MFYIYFSTSLYAQKEYPRDLKAQRVAECLPSPDVQLIFVQCVLSQTAQMQETFPYKKISQADAKEH